MKTPTIIAASIALALAPFAVRAEDGPAPFVFAQFASGRDRPHAVDVNGDGFADLLAFAGNDVWVAISEGGQKCRGGSVWAGGFASPDELAAAGDFDGDGRCDVCAIKKDGTISVGISDGKSSFVVSTWSCAADKALLAQLAASGRPLIACDVDGDGFADLVLPAPSLEPGECLWLRNTGTRSFEAPKKFGTAPRDAVAGDFDGDGKADLAWWRANGKKGETGRVFVARGGAPAAEPEVWAENAPGPILAAGDANGDARADLAVRGAWLLSHGAGFVVAPDARLAPNPEAACSVGDCDGDGDGDLYVFERAGDCFVKILLSRGPHFGPPESWTPLGLKRDERASVVALGSRRALVGRFAIEGDGKLGVLPPAPSAIDATDVRAGDLDGDGVVDLVRVRGGAVEWARGKKDGGFEPFVAIAKAESSVFALPRVDGSRVAVTFARSSIVLKDGEVWTRDDAPFGDEKIAALLAADVDGDGREDLIGITEKNAVFVALAKKHGLEKAVAFALEPKDARPIFAGDLRGPSALSPRGAPADLVAEVPGGIAVLAGDARLRAFRRIGPLFKGPGRVLGLADLAGTGQPQLLLAGPAGDLLVARLGGSIDRDADGLTDRDEVRIYGTDPNVRDTDGDGLLDGWEVRGFRGIRLDRMGASPARRDVFLELAVEQQADIDRVHRAVARMEKEFAAAPIENPDGSRGISFHGIVAKRIPLLPENTANPPSRQELREMYFTPNRAGLFHWMHLGARGGGGQADMMADQGSCAGVFEATLPHEFGHQLGLNHGGNVGTNGIPTYPSIMNYAYNYDPGVFYSSGALAHFALDERALPEVLDVPFEKLRYLAGGPFHFRVEPIDGGKRTWVDWNRNGVRDEKPVMANVNAIAGDGYGPRHILDDIARVSTATVTEHEPVLVDVSGDLALLYSEKGSGRLAARVLKKGDDDPAHFGPVKTLLDVRGLSDVAAVAVGDELRVFAVKDGAVIGARGTLERGLALEGTLDGSRGKRPSLVARGERVYLFLLAPDGSIECGAKTIDGVRSSSPAGLTLDTKKDEIVLVTTDEKTWRLRCTRLDPATLAVKKSEPVGGPHASDATSRRPAVVFETSPWLPDEGRVDIFHAGILDVPGPNTHMYRSYTIGDKAWLGRDGWKEDQTFNEWSYSTAGPGAALRNGRPWQVTRFWTPYGAPNPYDDHIAIAPIADGICDDGMRDHDDWAVIRDRGLARSILHTWEPRGRLAIGK